MADSDWPAGHPDKPHGVVVDTSYGQRTTCGECGRRWTRLHKMVPGIVVPIVDDREWVEETYSPLRDNLGSDDGA